MRSKSLNWSQTLNFLNTVSEKLNLKVGEVQEWILAIELGVRKNFISSEKRINVNPPPSAMMGLEIGFSCIWWVQGKCLPFISLSTFLKSAIKLCFFPSAFHDGDFPLSSGPGPSGLLLLLRVLHILWGQGELSRDLICWPDLLCFL